MACVVCRAENWRDVKKSINIDDLILNYDPEFPQQRFLDAGVDAAFKSSSGRLPSAPPWPAASKPVAVPLDPAPAETDDLTRFHGYDAVIVTWTSAEAAALGAVLTPDYLPSRWYEYRHNVAAYVPLVTGGMAPFKDNTPDMARYYHSLGLYFPCTIGKAKVLLFKSGLHLDYDGPAVPVQKLMAELVQTIAPKVFITTGTGGGIGKNVALGDVVMAGRVRFDCVTQFKSKPWAAGSYKTSALPAGALAAITPDLTRVNAARVVGGRATPKIWSSADDTIVTTDFFGFDDSTDYYKLQGNGARACDMGDAMVANSLQAFPDTAFYAIRNASDPQIPNPTNNLKAAKLQAGQIYTEYGAFTTAASVIASWAVVDATFNSAKTSTSTATESGDLDMAKKSKSKDKLKKVFSDPADKLKTRIPSEHGGYGWARDLPDARDVLYAAPLMGMAKGLPTKVDLRPKCPPIYNQGQLGCCTGNGIAGAIEFDQMKLGKTKFTPSRLFIYYNERVMENTVATDAGAQIRDGIKSVATVGAPPETVWPYDIAKFADKPPAIAYTDAKLDLVASYAKVAQILQQMQGCLADGYPFVLGFTVYESFESAAVAKSGIVPMPTAKEKVVGGHCVVAVGYDDATRTFIIRNSWGTSWGMKGYCTMPYEYLLSAHLASDFWTIRAVTE
jgi:C1A family cysteine protease/nucleoside phosphorylase